jgi:O-succinylbenzoic acid--CoA ligase
VVTAVYVPSTPKLSVAVLQAALKHQLSKFKQPQCWVPLESLPRNSQGKINQEQLQQIVWRWQQQDPPID